VDPYMHSSIRLHGVVFNSISTGTTLPYLASRRETMSEVMRKSDDDIKMDLYRYMRFTVLIAIKILWSSE
jgi:hypothetical protein